jgi:predicted RNA-binding protein YlxR (DUF448 family)
MRQKKIPMRKCVACQEMRPKREMIRIVKTPEDTIIIDVTGKKSGRGAYLCGYVECLQTASKNHALERALKTKVPPEIYEQLGREYVFSRKENS